MPLISAEDYDAFVCSSCVRSIYTLRRYAGTQGVIMVVRDSEDSPWRKLGGNPLCVDAPTTMEDDLLDIDDSLAGPGQKRSRSHSFHSEAPERKKQHILPESSSPCLAPAPNLIAQAIFQGSQQPSDTKVALGEGDVFLTDGWRGRWCRCSRVSFPYARFLTFPFIGEFQCFPSLSDHPYLLEEEETYEPPEDPDSGTHLILIRSSDLLIYFCNVSSFLGGTRYACIGAASS
jgi:E3 ubiquitin-protein ligase UBR7